MNWLTQFRIGLFEFLAFPAHIWLRLCAFLIGEFSVEHDDYEDEDYDDDDPPWCGG